MDTGILDSPLCSHGKVEDTSIICYFTCTKYDEKFFFNYIFRIQNTNIVNTSLLVDSRTRLYENRNVRRTVLGL